MSSNDRHSPEDTDYSESRGAGLAAILLFLQIALIGYLLYALYFLLTGDDASSSLRPFRAGWQYFLPAALAVGTFMPTDPLTRVVGKIAAVTGVVSWTIFSITAWSAATRSPASTSILPANLPGSFTETLAGLLWGSAVGGCAGVILAKRLQSLRSGTMPGNTHKGLIVPTVLLAIGGIAGAITWHWQGNGIMHTWEYVAAALSVGGLAGLSAVRLGTGSVKSGVTALFGLFLCMCALCAAVLVQVGGPRLWLMAVSIAGISALITAVKAMSGTARAHFSEKSNR